MILYKYFPPARIDSFQDCLIRFTQYGDFNDPFELNPHITKLAEKKEIRAIVEKDFVKIIEEEYFKNPKISAFISKEDFISLSITHEESVKNAVVGMEAYVVKLLPSMLQKTANSFIGALSLSEICDHELMWSHYAEEHKGVVVGFDSSHPFFNRQKSVDDELRHPRKIEYRDRPPVINLMKTTGAELFFVKSSRWEYEAEWRMLLPLSEATKIIKKDPYAIHLFKFPAQSVKKIILGARTTDRNKSIVREILAEHEYSHIELYQAQLERSSYGILINKENG